MSRLSHEYLRDLALYALEDVVADFHHRPNRPVDEKPSPLLRLALAYLCHMSNAPYAPFLRFWKTISGEGGRPIHVCADMELNDICAAIGARRDPNWSTKLNRQWFERVGRVNRARMEARAKRTLAHEVEAGPAKASERVTKGDVS